MITTGTGEETAMVTVTEMITDTDEEITIEMTGIEEITTEKAEIHMAAKITGITTETNAQSNEVLKKLTRFLTGFFIYNYISPNYRLFLYSYYCNIKQITRLILVI